jgi:phosphatidylinositol-3-phosphatase
VRGLRSAIAIVALAVAVLVQGTLAAGASALPPIRHVFLVWLENKSYAETFGPNSKAPYLNHALLPLGQALPNYYGIGHASLDNYIAVISGQPPNPQTQADCQIYTDFVGSVGPDGVAVGNGCVYPAGAVTLGDQLNVAGYSWRGYAEDMGPMGCRHPALNSADGTQSAKVGDQYAARHNPWVYFHSVIDSPSCSASDVDLSRLPSDLAFASRTANFNFIVPNLCNDGHDAPCVDGSPGGLVSSDQWLAKWVPLILASPAYKADGMLVIAFDEAEANDASACCNEPSGPNTPNPGGTTAGPGGGRVGALVISPYVKPGSVNQASYNHYAFLRSVEDLFGLQHLAEAAATGLQPFGADVFNGTPGGPGPALGCDGAALVRPRGRVFAPGVLVRTLRLAHHGRRALLTVRVARDARLSVADAPRGRGRKRTLRTRSLKGCRTLRIALPYAHGVVRLSASAAGAVERRSLSY